MPIGLKSNLSAWMLSFTGHGFSKLARAKSQMEKIFWSSIILSSFTLCLFFIITTLQQFFDFEVVTNIRLKHTGELEFPAVTFCTNNNLTKENMLDCKFNNIKCKNSDLEEITIFFLGTDQTCLRFNGRKLDAEKKFLVQRPGWEHGFGLGLCVDHIHYHVGLNSYLPISKNFEYIKTGSYLGFGLKQTLQNTLGRPYNQCLKAGEHFNSDLYIETIQDNYTYRQINCYEICFKKHYKQFCISFDNNCYTNFTSTFDYRAMCNEYCPIECDLVSFDATMFEYDGDSYLERSDCSHINSNASLIEIWIFYKTLDLTEIEQISKMTVTDLVSSIGGTLGNLFHEYSFE